MKKICFVGSLCLVFLFLSGVSRAESLIGFVDMNQVIQQSAAGMAAIKELTDFKERKNAGMDVREKKLQQLKDQISQKMGKNPVDTGLAKLQKDFQTAVQEYNKLKTDNQAEISKKDRALTQDILEEVYVVCNDLKREKGFTYIYDKGQSGIIVFPPENEITRDVILRYDKKYKAVTN